MLANFILIHEQTDYLLSYPDENTMTTEQESQFLQKKADSEIEIEILAEGPVNLFLHVEAAKMISLEGGEKVQNTTQRKPISGIEITVRYGNIHI